MHISLAPSEGERCIAPPRLPPNTASLWDVNLSPYQRFRSYGRLSVTDLVSPAWCEVQFEYGLQQQRSRRIDTRPQSIVTRQGKEISVKKKTAELNDVVLREGHAVHSALEREIRPVTVKVRTTSLEEEWGLKLFNMLNDMETLLLLGKCREFPVMGFIDDQLVVGVIVETFYQKRNLSSHAHYRTKSIQLTLHRFFPTTPSKNGSSKVDEYGRSASSNSTANDTPMFRSLASSNVSFRKTHTLHLIDHKTRLSPTLPPESATLSSRLQLMLYRRLLDGLVSLKSPFDFHRLWEHLRLDPTRKFSTPFLKQLYPNERPWATCIQNLQDQWSTVLGRLEVEEEGFGDASGGFPIHQQLTVIYRRRAAGKDDRRRRVRQPSLEPSSEDKDLQAAILASLRQPDVPARNTNDEVKLGNGAGDSLNAPDVSGAPNVRNNDADTMGASAVTPVAPQPQKQDGSQVLHPDTTQSNSHSECNTAKPGDDVDLGGIIGTLEFQHDDALLNEHLARVLQWWYGKRDPVGVSIENIDRCMTCEYADGCEWREQLAQEVKQISMEEK
ncbi:exonuclease V [Hysterangium stoloniferum]|nr:exonuclease V [Hysterangium stoloniferum]